MYRQVYLRHDDARLVCWLRDDPTVRPGALIQLRGQDAHWEVVRVLAIRSAVRAPDQPREVAAVL